MINLFIPLRQRMKGAWLPTYTGVGKSGLEDIFIVYFTTSLRSYIRTGFQYLVNVVEFFSKTLFN